jgi:hypothetical protein
LAAAPVLASVDDLLIDDLTDDEDARARSRARRWFR